MKRLLFLSFFALTTISAAPIAVQITSGTINFERRFHPAGRTFFNFGVQGGSVSGDVVIEGAFQSFWGTGSSAYVVNPDVYIGYGFYDIGTLVLQLGSAPPVVFRPPRDLFQGILHGANMITIDPNGPLTFTVPFSGQIRAIDRDNTGTEYLLNGQGTVRFTFSGGAPRVVFQSATVTFSEVPEPTSFVLAGSAGLFFAARALLVRRQRASKTRSGEPKLRQPAQLR